MKTKVIAAALGLAGLLGAQPALAEVTYGFSGFGTLGATHSDTREADYRGSILQPNGPGNSGSTMFGVDTKLGVQGTANFGSGLTGTVQVIADHRFDNSYRPEFEWANFKYQVNNNWSVRAGRVVVPVFMLSDFRNIGYSQINVRPPYEVYMLNPLTHMDGVEVAAKFEVAGGTLSAQMSGGRLKTKVKNNGGWESIDIRGANKNINLTYEKGTSTFRFGYNKSRVASNSGDFDMLDQLFSYSYLVGSPVPNADMRNIRTTLLDLGYIYDDGKWLAQGEYVQDRGDGPAIQDVDAWSLLLGYRLSKFTPYVGYARMISKEPPLKYPPPVNPAAVGSPMYPLYQLLVDGINRFDEGVNIHNQQHTVTLGTRYDVYKNVALKAQWDRTYKPSMAPGLNRGTFTNTTTAFSQGAYTVNLYTVTLDFVF